MVSSTKVESPEPMPVIKTAEGIPAGSYQLVGWDMDTTGKKLIDEICQIAGYIKGSVFAQYVMPFKDLTPPARKRHNLKVATIGKFRMLKNTKTNKVLKTKSEVTAITDFLSWLETIKGDAEDGVILIHHESRQVNPLMLLDSLIKYQLLDRFKKTVKGFVNGFDVAGAKCAKTLRAFSLRTLSRVLLDQEEQCDNAVDRARLALEIVQHLSISEADSPESEDMKKNDGELARATVEFIREFVQPTSAEEKEYQIQKLVLQRQYNLKPIFKPLQLTRRERQHSTPLRRLLAEADIDYTQLTEAWTTGQKEALEKLINDRVSKATAKQLEDLVLVLECHFDPEKKSEIQCDMEEKNKNSGKYPRKSRKNVIGSENADSYSSIKMKLELPDTVRV